MPVNGIDFPSKQQLMSVIYAFCNKEQNVMSKDKKLTEPEKMKAGKLFNPADKSFFFTLARAEWLQRKLNKAPLWAQGRKERIFKKLVGSVDGKPYNIFTPFKVVCGKNIHIGKNFFANWNLCLQDYAEIHIGDNVFIAVTKSGTVTAVGKEFSELGGETPKLLTIDNALSIYNFTGTHDGKNFNYAIIICKDGSVFAYKLNGTFPSNIAEAFSKYKSFETL